MPGPRDIGRLAVLVFALAALPANGVVAPVMAQVTVCTSQAEPDDRPENAQVITGAACIQGDLARLTDQDLFIWDIPALDALHTWTVTIDGVPATITSIRLFRITSPTDAPPVVDTHELWRVDSSAEDRTPGVMTDVTLAPGRYLVGISRGAPVGGGDLPTGPYVARMEAQGDVPPSGDTEPNDAATNAVPVPAGPTFDLSGDAAGSADVYAWTIAPDDAGNVAWDLALSMPFAAQGSSNLAIAAEDGRVLATAPVDQGGTARIYDLQLPAGRYLLQIPAAAVSQPYLLSSAIDMTGRSDPEPNDTPDTAVVLVPSAAAAHGRLAIDRDTDFYRLPVDAGLASTQIDVALTWDAGPARQLCLYRDRNTLIQCADGGPTEAVLSDLQLPAAEYTLQVIGDESPADGYAISVQDIGPVRADREIEPNDDGLTATLFDPAVAISGRSAASDVDTYRVSVPGDVAQAWRLDAAGAGLELLEWIGRDGSVLTTGEVSADHAHASVWDMYLVPGDHWIHVRASGGAYQLAMTPLGPLGGDSEREPNNDALTAQTIPVDGTRTGRLPDPTDSDVFRFSLAADDHVAVRLDPPLDAAIEMELTSGTTTLASYRAPVAGAPVVYEGVLWPGDYEIHLTSASRSASPWKLAVERLDPFTPAAASPPPSPPLGLTLRPATREVAAWSRLGQRVSADLVLKSTSAAETEVALTAILSDQTWSLAPGMPGTVRIPANGTLSVPFVVELPADVPAGVPVRVSVAATTSDGARATTSMDLLPGRDTPLVDGYQAWHIPDALLGGLDIASLALGGTPWGSAKPVTEALLHDGVAVSGTGFSGQTIDGVPTMSVDLAGEDPVSVVGTVIDTLAFDGQLQYRPREFELLLSDDGTTWRSALQGVLQPVGVEQSFVLPEPVTARYAQLRVTSSYGSAFFGGAGDYAPIGEWKVVAAPGTAPTSEPLNIADPVRDGHVVWMDPQPSADAYANGMLSEDPTSWLPYLARDQAVRFVVGFHDDRTAQVTQLQWVDPPGSTPATRPAQVHVDVSVDGPMGPWQPVGTWMLDRATDGSVTPFTLPDPTWASFIRFTLAAPTTASYWEMPSTVRVLERPPDAQYRSILGQWGMGDRHAIHDVLVPQSLPVPDTAPDHDGTSATATSLRVGEVATGSVHRKVDEDWYVIQMPPVHDELTLDLEGDEYVDAVVELFDDAGSAIPVAVSEGPTGASQRVRATVVPGATYRIRVTQPPVSVIITYDTSGSLGPYLSYVGQALRSFAAGVTPGQEAMRITPFEESSLLDDWSDDPNALQSAVESQVLHAFSSSVEAATQAAAKGVGARTGTRAILVMSDGDTLSYNARSAMWQWLGAARPAVFGVHVAGSGDAVASTHLMQDLSSAGGQYQYASSHGDIDGAFDRVATRLRGPAPYALSVATSEIPKSPGTIRVRSGSGPVIIGGDVAIELVLDTSGSMNRRIGKRTRIDIARSVLHDLVTDTLPPGIPVAYRTFRAGKGSCDTVLSVPLGPLDPDAMAARVAKTAAGRTTRTPLGAALHAVGSDLAEVHGPAVVVLVTDGQETCKGDPAAEVRALIAQGLDVQLNIVGFAIDDAGLQADLAAWAALGHGSSFVADNAKDLGRAIAKALAAPFRVRDANGTIVGSGTVGGDAVAVPAGTYQVEVLSDPVVTYDAVVVGSGAGVELVVGAQLP